MTGSPGQWPIEWLAERLDQPVERALSLGSGEGALERDLMGKGLCRSILGIDVSKAAIEIAVARAEAAGLSGVSYRRANLNHFELPAASYQAAFAHQALHHVEDLEHCLATVHRALVPGGFLYLDEYVGPSRSQWRHELLASAEAVFARLPRQARRKRLQLPVDWRDPTEAIRSSEILEQASRFFETQEQRDYGGNLLSVIYPHLRLEGLESDQRAELLSEIIAAEKELLASGVRSYYSVIVARRRPVAD